MFDPKVAGDVLKCSQIDGMGSLNQNQISDIGAKALAEALKVNKTLTFLGHFYCGRLDNQRVPAPADLKQMEERAEASANARSAVDLADKNQKLRSKLEARDRELQESRSELATNELKLQQLQSYLTSALDRIVVLECNQLPVGASPNFDGPIPQIPLATLFAAANNFADPPLGEGAFGRVYSGFIPGPRIAIKRLSAESKQGKDEFKSELDSLSKFRHPNIIAILSFAEEGDERCLVYEFMSNGSVRDRLSRKNGTPPLTWAQRYRIATDVARGMHYVQTAFPDHALFHLDLKTSNVLLDAHFNAKVSDFGLVRVAQHLDDVSYLRTQNRQGTTAYMCPDLLEEGRITIKTDVYAFGMILLELVTGMKAAAKLKSDSRKALKADKFVGLVDSTIKEDGQGIKEVVSLALECLDEAANDRPSFGGLLATLDA
ncbi:hypothetical protein CAOG_07517 [Capsaspora owczarzaki ATCC 30864]|uniref:hypothetical protein n=1 Tax=Capsaspora owczarzaki (strain ATCC 30864) TaxID=595528 RepID=UPI0001FE4FBF|nr:hypothetical protein CAOG_07517 [Capsaspora owczarzaki ATCC 30864]|eukprot:XP_004343391.1 hypothetical protein CAOG_07517 [Capsaspora owczarzaki ATCC 30864]